MLPELAADLNEIQTVSGHFLAHFLTLALFPTPGELKDFLCSAGRQDGSPLLLDYSGFYEHAKECELKNN